MKRERKGRGGEMNKKQGEKEQRGRRGRREKEGKK